MAPFTKSSLPNPVTRKDRWSKCWVPGLFPSLLELVLERCLNTRNCVKYCVQWESPSLVGGHWGRKNGAGDLTYLVTGHDQKSPNPSQTYPTIIHHNPPYTSIYIHILYSSLPHPCTPFESVFLVGFEATGLWTSFFPPWIHNFRRYS